MGPLIWKKPLTLTLSRGNGGTLNCAPSADAVAGEAYVTVHA